MRFLFKSVNLIGDALYIGPALREFLKHAVIRTNGDDTVYLETLNDHITPLYTGMVRDLPAYNRWFKVVHERPEGTFDFEHVFDVNKAFRVSDEKKQHVAKSYADLLGLESLPDMHPVYIPEKWYENELQGCILISMFSMSCQSRDKNHPGMPPNKMLPWAKWKPMIELLRERFPTTEIYYLGAPEDRPPMEFDLWLHEKNVDRKTGIKLNSLALIMKEAKMLVTIDNGMSHLAATQDTPTFLMYPRCLGIHYILPVNPNLEYRHIDPVFVSPAQLRHALDHAINKWEEKEK